MRLLARQPLGMFQLASGWFESAAGGGGGHHRAGGREPDGLVTGGDLDPAAGVRHPHDPPGLQVDAVGAAVLDDPHLQPPAHVGQHPPGRVDVDTPCVQVQPGVVAQAQVPGVAGGVAAPEGQAVARRQAGPPAGRVDGQDGEVVVGVGHGWGPGRRGFRPAQASMMHQRPPGPFTRVSPGPSSRVPPGDELVDA